MTFLAPAVYILKHAILLALVVLSSCGAGIIAERIFKLNKSKETTPLLERIFFIFCLGLGAWSYTIFCLGICHLIYKIALAAVFAITLCPYLLLLKKHNYDQARTHKNSTVGFIALLTIITIPVFMRSLYCAIGWDDTMYHLPIATTFLENHSLVLTPFLRYVIFNNFTNLLFIPLIAVGGDTAAQQISVASFIFCGVGIYALLSRFSSRNAGLIGLLAWSSAQYFYELGSTALIDMNLALMGLAGVFAGLKAFTAEDDSERSQNAIAAGIYFGCTVASKLLGALLLAAFAVSANAVNFVTTRFKFTKAKNDLILCMKMMLIAGLVLSPWLIRSWLATGNPIWPFAEKIFGIGSWWSAIDYQSQAESLAATQGISRSVPHFLIMPWLISFKSEHYDQLVFTPFVALGVYLGVPLLFAKGFRSTKIVFTTVLIFLLLWFVATQQVRYLMAAAPIMCVLAGAVFDRYVNAFIKNTAERAYLVATVCAIVLFSGFEHTAYLDMFNDYARLPFNKVLRNEYLCARLPMVKTMNILNILPEGRAFGLSLEKFQYFAHGRIIGDWFGPARIRDFVDNCGSGDELYAYLKSLDVKYLVEDLEIAKRFNLPHDASFGHHFRNIYCDGTGVIYQLQE